MQQRGKVLVQRIDSGSVREGSGRRMITSEVIDNLRDFMSYARGLEGDEKGEAQVFCDRLFRAFGHEGYKEAGATLGPV